MASSAAPASSLARVLTRQRAELRAIQARIIRGAAPTRAQVAALRETTLQIMRALRAGGATAGMNAAAVRALVDDQHLFAALTVQARQVNQQALNTLVREVYAAQLDLAGIAARHLEVMLEHAGVVDAGRTIPVRAANEIVGLLRPGSPFRGLAGLAAEQVDGIGDVLVQGVVRGYSPMRVARNIVDHVVGVPQARAATIARTEVMRAYRGSSSAMYQASSAVTGWVWQTSGGVNTCAACLAMEGSEHSPEETIDGHPNCECMMVPMTIGWDGTIDGAGATNAESLGIASGEDTFAAMTPAEQLAKLGPTKYALYRDGKITLRDLVHVRRSREWGASVQVASVKQALRNAA